MPTEMERRNSVFSDGAVSPPTSDDGEAVDIAPLRTARRRLKSRSFEAVKSALYQLTRLNDFQTEKIGAGFFADVYKVTHKATGEIMVLKMNKNRKNSKQMLAEIQLMNRLSHPNILSFKGSCVHEGQLHALTEYINGGSLDELLQNKGLSLSWSVRLKIARDIAHGMAYLHSREVFHRDLTSKNCLIQREPNGDVRTVVADFGLAAKIKHKRRSYTEVVGSPYWMAPECLSGSQYCEQADVFSYGIILAEVISRIPADPDFMPRTQQFGVNFEELRSSCPDCPDILWDLTCRCCQVDPDDRPTFSQIIAMFDELPSQDSCPILSSSASESALCSQASIPPPSPSNSTDGIYRIRSGSTDLEDQLASLLEDQELSPPFYTRRKEFTITPRPLSSGDPGSVDSDVSLRVDLCENRNHCDNYRLNESSGYSNLSTPPWSSHARQRSDASDISFTLPAPSQAWAPPPSPILGDNSPSPPLRGVSLTSFNGFSSSSSDSSPTLKPKTVGQYDTFCHSKQESPAVPVGASITQPQPQNSIKFSRSLDNLVLAAAGQSETAIACVCHGATNSHRLSQDNNSVRKLSECHNVSSSSPNLVSCRH